MLQGSVLGPLLFLLYINDIQEVIQHSFVKVFADDVALYKEVLSLSDCVPLQGHLNSIHLWAVCWQLHLNASKCEALLISKKRNPVKASYALGESFIPWKPLVKYLEVFINSELITAKSLQPRLLDHSITCGILCGVQLILPKLLMSV